MTKIVHTTFRLAQVVITANPQARLDSASVVITANAQARLDSASVHEGYAATPLATGAIFRRTTPLKMTPP